jgi:hypothetical protein
LPVDYHDILAPLILLRQVAAEVRVQQEVLDHSHQTSLVVLAELEKVLT